MAICNASVPLAQGIKYLHQDTWQDSSAKSWTIFPLMNAELSITSLIAGSTSFLIFDTVFESIYHLNLSHSSSDLNALLRKQFKAAQK